MMESFERFGLIINDTVVRTPIALASMAGIVDADYALARAPHIGAAFIGGYSIDKKTMEAARDIAAGGERKEFLYDDPVAELTAQMNRMKGSDLVLGLNLRGSAPESFGAIADALGDSVVYEIDAHCRQKPMVDAGCGEHFLTHPQELLNVVRILKGAGVTVSVKVRAGVAADDRVLAKKLWSAGADILHVDLMDFGIAKLRQIRNSCPLLVIANNSVSSFDAAKDMFSHGADLVSLARKSDKRTLSGLDAAITRYTDEQGWYNSPKQLCRGGDIRALTFCCMPVKECPLIPTLKRIGMTKEEFLTLKMAAGKNTPLEGGPHTCFGSLVWCCKTSSPCMFRDMTLKEEKLNGKEYMRLKRELSDTIMGCVFHDVPHDDAG
jgi:tRNA-dihydrouridine synthase B